MIFDFVIYESSFFALFGLFVAFYVVVYAVSHAIKLLRS